MRDKHLKMLIPTLNVLFKIEMCWRLVYGNVVRSLY